MGFSFYEAIYLIKIGLLVNKNGSARRKTIMHNVFSRFHNFHSSLKEDFHTSEFCLSTAYLPGAPADAYFPA